MLDQTQRDRIDHAYVGHAILAVAVGWIGGIGLAFDLGWIDVTTADVLEMVTGIGVALIGLGGLIVAILESIRLWRVLAEEKGLLILLLVLTLTTIMAMSVKDLPNWGYSFYPLIAALAIVRWFGIARHRRAGIARESNAGSDM